MIEKPEQLATIDEDTIREAAQRFLDSFDADQYVEDRIDDHEGLFSESVMEAVFGEDVHDWICQQQP